MFFILFAGLLVALLVMCGLCTASFFSVAFAGPQQFARRPSRRAPPRREAAVPSQLPVMSSCKGKCRRCPSEGCLAGKRAVAVTPPEAFAIAEYVRSTQPPREVERILITAAAEAARWAEQPAAASAPRCALLAGDGHCLAGPVRPEICHVAPAASATAAGESRTPGDPPSPADGLRQGLRLAGLDITPYELNGAVAVALSQPDGARRWQQHEPIFAACRTMQ